MTKKVKHLILSILSVFRHCPKETVKNVYAQRILDREREVEARNPRFIAECLKEQEEKIDEMIESLGEPDETET